MELCDCDHYQDIVEKFKFFTVGTLLPIIPRKAAPENSYISWKYIKANHEDLRLNKPVIISCGPQKREKEKMEEVLESKWIPVSPGLVSQKSVNESK